MIQTEPRRMTISQIYKESGIMYIRYDGEIETQSNGQQKIGGSRPAFNNMEKQVEYRSGRIYSLLMGREFKPNQCAILFDFDNKEEGGSKSGLELAKELNMDQYYAPKQHTPSGGLHYIFYVDGEQAT